MSIQASTITSAAFCLVDMIYSYMLKDGESTLNFQLKCLLIFNLEENCIHIYYY
jgi:hypothetical protein